MLAVCVCYGESSGSVLVGELVFRLFLIKCAIVVHISDCFSARVDIIRIAFMK